LLPLGQYGTVPFHFPAIQTLAAPADPLVRTLYLVPAVPIPAPVPPRLKIVASMKINDAGIGKRICGGQSAGSEPS
jgi:hypothetical protein